MNSERATSLIMPIVAVGLIVLIMLSSAIKSGWLAKFLTDLNKPSEEEMKKRSNLMLAEMHRNVAERKARKNNS